MEMEREYLEKTGLEHRKKFAQFFTPQPIADLMVDWILGNERMETVLEPAFGLGIFSRMLLNKKNDLNIKGFEIDEIILKEARIFLTAHKNISIRLEDYMLNDWDNKYDGIICNPPYLKFHDYNNKEILKEVESRIKYKLTGFTNLYTLFLLKSIFQLNKNGRAAYIIPSEFLNADYGKLVKEYLLKTNTLRHFFVIDFKENVFDGALTTASILLLANDKHNLDVNFSLIESKSDLKQINQYVKSYPHKNGQFCFDFKFLNPNVKWRNYYRTQNSLDYKDLVPFSNYAKVMRGIATGANEYFTFRPSKVKKFSIPKENLLPCICKAKDVKGNFFTSIEFDNLKNKDELVYLFNGENKKDIKSNEYIKKGEQEKINERFLTKSRKPWYAIEKRPPSPIWVSVFNREYVKFIRNEANISNLTTFHCVYPVTEDLFSNTNIDLLFAYLLTNVAKEIFDDNRREYGNGLKKFEPNDLNKSKMLDIGKLPKEKVDKVLDLYLDYKNSKNENSIKEIDSIFRKEFSRVKNHTDPQSSPLSDSSLNTVK